MRKPDVIMKIEAAWNELSDTIDERQKGHDQDSLANNHFVIWEEADIPFQIGRFLLNNQKNNKYEFHLEMNLTTKNFESYSFSDNGSLEEVKKVLKVKKSPRVDFLVDDRSNSIFPAIGEAKYFRYSIKSVSRGKRDAISDLDKDYKRLHAFIHNQICKYGVYFVVDHYYHRKEKEIWKKIKAKLNKIESDGIYVFTKEV